jgi:hypothetical protein
MGDWKLVINGSITANELKKANAKNAAAENIELFHLAEDPYEKNNLAGKNPEKVQQLRSRLDAYRAAALPPKAEDEPANYKAPRVWGE